MLAALAMIVFAAGGCSPAPRPPREGAEGAAIEGLRAGLVGEVELVAARDSVANPDRPVYPLDSARVDRLWTAQGADWEEPIRIALSPERVFVLDPRARAIHTVLRSGLMGPRADRYVSFRGPTGIAWSGGLLAVADTSYEQIFITEEFGPERRSVAASPSAAVVAVGNRRFAVTDRGEGALDWRVVGEEPARDATLSLPPAPADPKASGCARVSGGRRLIQSSCYLPAFRVVDANGRRTRRVDIDRSASGVDGPLAGRLQARLGEYALAGEETPPALIDSVKAVNDAMRPVRGVRYDEAGRRFAVWSVAPDGVGTRVDVLSAEGVYLGRVDFDAPWLDFAFDRGVLFALERRPGLGAYWLAAYAIGFSLHEVTAVAGRARKAAP
ncbi:hypothetical protein [Longimicrobium sp.]|uniref:hypothetical protein n=1 Tax=Longimicrobium sp. TaxID=2029185 RepID=UPI002BA2BC4C|nr:hypothetical protein [Longimicrobium sp.]HSU13983.1 hypothetical protein [Longimicrobium sp.]